MLCYDDGNATSEILQEINRCQNDNQMNLHISTNKKDPVKFANMDKYKDRRRERGSAVSGGGLPDETIKGPYTSLSCRSLRIGSYKVMPKERVIFATEGIRMKIPTINKGKEKEMVTINIPVHKILKILANFGRSLPVFFIYVNPSTGSSIRNALKMTDQSGLYFDPSSRDESQKRIIILPDKLMEDSRTLFIELYKSKSKHSYNGASKQSNFESKHCLLEELDQKAANEILLRSSPPEVQNIIKKSTICNLSEVKGLFIYPPAPQKGGITISTDDYACLEEQEFLNDVIIDFYLKWLLHDKFSEVQRKQTHVFSTYFYKRLTTKPKRNRPHSIEDDPKLTAAEKRHARVKSWTKNVDIFSKDYIIVPINENSHWYLAIICYPGLDEPVCISTNTPVARETLIKPERKLSSHPTSKKEIVTLDDGDSERDEAEGDAEEFEDHADDDIFMPPVKKFKSDYNSGGVECNLGQENNFSQTSLTFINNGAGITQQRISQEGGADNQATSIAASCSAFGANIHAAEVVDYENCKKAVKQPCILIFDSLSGGNKSRIVATLRDYLAVEHKTRKEIEKTFTKETMKGACPKVPQQTNYSDCGIFTLQFAESFFEHPLKDYTFPIHGLVEWFPQSLVRGKREAIAKLIKSLMEKYNPNHESIELPEISFAPPQKKEETSKDPVFDKTNEDSVANLANTNNINMNSNSNENEEKR